VPWRPRPRRLRRRDDEIVAVRIAFQETELRERAKRLGAVGRPAQRLREISWRDAKRLGIAERVRESDAQQNHPPPDICRHTSRSISRSLHLPMDASSMPRMSFDQ